MNDVLSLTEKGKFVIDRAVASTLLFMWYLSAVDM